MARYRMDNGTVVDTDRATARYDEAKSWDGSNLIGRVTRSQWHNQRLYRSRRGRYYLEHVNRVQGEHDWCEWISREQAAAWLCLNEFPIPSELAGAAERVTE